MVFHVLFFWLSESSFLRLFSSSIDRGVNLFWELIVVVYQACFWYSVNDSIWSFNNFFWHFLWIWICNSFRFSFPLISVKTMFLGTPYVNGTFLLSILFLKYFNTLHFATVYNSISWRFLCRELYFHTPRQF